MNFVARLGEGPPPHLTCGNGKRLQRRIAVKDTISCGRVCEKDY